MQHDYIIDNQTRTNFRADLNLALQAIVSNNSDATEPTTMFAFMWWADTTTAILKQRNSSNTAWVDILDLTTGASVSTGINDLTNAILDNTLQNTGLGVNSLTSNTTGSGNVAVGLQSLYRNSEGNYNTAVGAYSLDSNTVGDKNTAIGNSALALNTNGGFNTAIGQMALNGNTSGNDNIGIGVSALTSNTTGDKNVAIGLQALLVNTIGYENIALGNYALSSNLSNQNIAIGNNALLDSTTGTKNIAIGDNVGNNITNESYSITMGFNVASLGSNYFTIGTGVGSNRVYNEFTANAVWTRVSDERFKKDIETNEDCGLAFINDLRTVTYKFKAPSELDPSLSEYDKDNDKPSHDKSMYGFIAQEVKQALDNHNIKDFAGWHVAENGKDKLMGVSYEMFVMPLVKSIQELSTKNKEFVFENQDLSDRIDEQNAAIDAMMLRIEALENTLE